MNIQYKTFDEFKDILDGEVLRCLEGYEDSIERFCRDIAYDGIQNIYSDEDVKRMQKFRYMTYGAIMLSENIQNISLKFNEKTIESRLAKWGMIIDELGFQFASTTFSAYVAATEDIRKHFIIFVDFEDAQDKGMIPQRWNLDKLTFGGALSCLCDIYPQNNFLKYLQDVHVPLRNLVAHYNYTWENNKLCLYERVFDEEPQARYDFAEFLQLALNLYILSTGLFLIYKREFIDPV